VAEQRRRHLLLQLLRLGPALGLLVPLDRAGIDAGGLGAVGELDPL
jgi:hypothetical protein